MKNKALLLELKVHENTESVRKYISLMDVFLSQNSYAPNFFSYLEQHQSEEVKLELDQLEKVFGKNWLVRNFF